MQDVKPGYRDGLPGRLFKRDRKINNPFQPAN
jgi:hypothetical protein